MNNKVKIFRTINESYTDIYLSIPGIVLAVGSMVSGIIRVSFLILVMLYFGLIIKVFLGLRKNRKNNDRIIQNGMPYKCEVIGVQIARYRTYSY